MTGLLTPDLLTLVQWLSPAFPTGGFAYSHGLEWAISAGEVTSSATLQAWLSDILRYGTGRSDAILLAHALHPDADLEALADIATALAPSAERLSESLNQGTALAQTISALTQREIPPRPLPIAFGHAAQTSQVPAADIIALYLHAFTANLTSAATRFIPLGQTDGQRTLATLHPIIRAVAIDATTAPLSAITSATFRADLASIQHETLPVRIFKT